MRRGFTLIEVLVVVAIIAGLSIASLLTLRTSGEEAKITATQSQINSLHAALISYRLDTKQWPPDYRPVNAAANNPLIVNPGVAGWRGPYFANYPEAHSWGGSVGFSLSPAGRAFIVLDNDRPRTSGNDNQGTIPNQSLVALDQALDDGDLANGNVVRIAGELIIYVDN